MLKHMVMMKLKAAEEMLLEERLKQLKSMLMALKEEIPALESMEVGINFSNRPTAMDIVLVSEFKNEAALDIYRVHPKHLEALAYIKEVVEEARVVDYWV